jgi:DNA invertase Pin-like site-specific DNA recombinase
MAVVCYARVSTTGQSLDTQLDQLHAAGGEKIFQEKISGAKRDRPQLAAMLEYIREGDTVIVTKLDRIARSTKDLLEIVDTLKKKGVAFKVLNIQLDTTTPTGKLMLTMLGGIAEFEREMMLERQAEGIAKAKTEGRYKGRKPTARAKAGEVIRLLEQGSTKKAIADELEIGIASVYRIINDEQTHTSNRMSQACKPQPQSL